MVARFACSIFAASSLGNGLPAAALHERCVSSCSSRSIPAWPAGLNDVLSIAALLPAISSSPGPVAQPAATAAANTIAETFADRFIGLALDRRRIERRTVGVTRQEHRQRDRRVRAEHELGKPLLAKAVVEPPFEGAKLALRHPVRWPRCVRLLRAGCGHEVRQVLKADALALVAVAGRASEVVRAGAIVENLLSDAIRL